jgi:glycerol-3-phosphate responsive antiterminator
MGGEIHAESQSGIGTAFIFSIQSSISTKSMIVPPSKNMNNFAGKRVLIVDNNQTNLKILEIQFGNWKFITILASSAPEVLSILNAPQNL